MVEMCEWCKVEEATVKILDGEMLCDECYEHLFEMGDR